MSLLTCCQVPDSIGNGDDGRTWESPLHDAVDVIVDRMLRRDTVEPVDGFSEDDLWKQKCLQNDIMQNHADYSGMSGSKAIGKPSRMAIRNNCDRYSREDFKNSTLVKVEW